MENKPETDTKNNHGIIWKDRKRFLGMPLSFTRYYIKNGRFYLSKGLFNVEENELLLYRIMDIKLNRTLGDKIVGVGTITLFTCDKTDSELKITRIKNPIKVRDLLSDMVEEARTKLRIRGKELYGVSDADVMDGDIMDTGM